MMSFCRFATSLRTWATLRFTAVPVSAPDSMFTGVTLTPVPAT